MQVDLETYLVSMVGKAFYGKWINGWKHRLTRQGPYCPVVSRQFFRIRSTAHMISLVANRASKRTQDSAAVGINAESIDDRYVSSHIYHRLGSLVFGLYVEVKETKYSFSAGSHVLIQDRTVAVRRVVNHLFLALCGVVHNRLLADEIQLILIEH